MLTTYNCWIILKHKHKHGVERVSETYRKNCSKVLWSNQLPKQSIKWHSPHTYTHTTVTHHNHNSIRANQYNPLITNGHYKHCGWTVNGVWNNRTNTAACYVHDCWAGTTKNLRQLSVSNWAWNRWQQRSCIHCLITAECRLYTYLQFQWCTSLSYQAPVKPLLEKHAMVQRESTIWHALILPQLCILAGSFPQITKHFARPGC